ncbi:TolC family outer membrane protein [Pseudoxanthomonas helianthi]|uniref:Protein CyaE n=1 Tax=Pseudoxanthomonas helianthi TaxID=1453541 RepID=A0A940WXR3_9GAMM|nr:TolC family outer membrane protein [Pseudoxanthomonas helianthi]MBP3983258.1 TolC family outer membrane protein [Pseudoxanthomonas helianthi]
MSRLPLVVALALALPTAAQATDLLQTYEMARAGDPQLAAAESDRLAQKEGAVQARGALLPQLNGSASLNRDHSSRPGSLTGDDRGRSYGVTLSQSVFDWANYTSLRGQKALSHAADYDLEAANDDLIVRTSNAYFDVLVARENLAAAEANETALKKQFDFAQARLDAGLAPITDLHEARAGYDSARASTILARNAQDDAYRALAEITGQPITELKALPDDFRPQLPAEASSEQWVNTALDKNPTLKSLQYQVQSAEAGVSTARAGHYPSLDLSGRYNNSTGWDSVHGPGTPGTSVDTEGRTIGLTLTVPIFSGGITQSRVREAIARRDSAQDGYEQTKRALVRSTSNAYQALVAGVSEVEARRLALVSAKSAYDASQVGLEVGTRTVLDVLNNQRTLFAAQLDYATAKYNFLRSRLGLEQAAGTLDIDDVQEVNRMLTVDAPAVKSQ